jgi:hypothetical protein
MKHLSLVFCSFLFTASFAQKSEDLIPRDAVTVFSINNFTLLQKVSLDDLVKYEFMAEVQSELFDGSTSGKTLKDAGIDFDQKMNIFYGRGKEFEISGFTFGIKNKVDLFQVFDDFQLADSKIPGTETYTSFFNSLIIKGNSALLIRVEPLAERVNELTDSIWYANGNESPWADAYEGMEEDLKEESEKEVLQEEIYEEMPEAIQPKTEDEFPVAEENPLQKNYYEMRDSVEMVLQIGFLDAICKDLFVSNLNLKAVDSRFAEQLTHPSEAIFFLDNSRNLQQSKKIWYLETMFPTLYTDLKELYTGNVLLGDLLLNNNSVEFKMESRYGEKLGSIYEKLNHSKFDKKVLNYIHKDNTAYFTYNVNLREAYEQAFKVIMPILTNEKNTQMSTSVLALDLLNEFINKDALFGTYKGSMFGTFNGIKKVKTTKIEFTYDEETFEYQEKEVKAEEDMPIFTLGFSTERNDIPLKVLQHLSRLTSRFQNKGTYWVFENAILNAAPLYMIANEGLFIFTNDQDLAENHVKGYGKEALTKKDAAKAAKSGSMYANINLAQAIDRFPRDFFTPKQNEILDAMRGKTGSMELTSSKTTKEKTSFDLLYTYGGTYDNAGKYLLDLMNSLYIISK